MNTTTEAKTMIKIENIAEKGWTRGGIHHERPALVGQHADIVPGESIRIHGTRYAGTPHARAYDLTFKLGGIAVYGGYNLTYTGTIVSIGAKTVTIEHEHSKQKTRLSIAQFTHWNDDFDLDKISARNAAWYD